MRRRSQREWNSPRDARSRLATVYSSVMKVSIIQLDIALGDPEKNIQRVGDLLASVGESDLVLLPELWSTGYALRDARQHASTRVDGTIAQMRGWAEEFDTRITGSVLEKDSGAVFNTQVFASPDGHTAFYRKLHLFAPMNEHTHLRAGEHPVVVETPWGLTGLSVCYDLRFPLLFQTYAEAGAKMIVIVAEWPAIREEHWITLVRARAIETQCFVLACNRSGADDSTVFAGRSMVVDPWGEIIALAGDGETILNVEIDPSFVEEVRLKIPVRNDRKERSVYMLPRA